LFHEMAARLRQVADFKILNFSLHHPLHRLMQLHWWEGEPAADFPVQAPVSESASGWVWEHQEELSFPRLRGETRFPRVLDALRAKGTETYYVVPLTTPGRLRVCQRKA
jgi:hypothetical protein